MTLRPSTISPANLGLGPESEPVTKRSRKGRNLTYHGVFASTKATGLAIYNSLLERDFQTVLCADPRITCYAAQPHQLTFWRPLPIGGHVARTYTPDACARLRDGRIVIFEVKHSALLERSGWNARESHIRQAYSKDHGLPLILLTEREIRVQPRLSNFQMMLRFSHPQDDLEAEFAIRDALHQLGAMPKIWQVLDFCLLCSERQSRGFSAILRMALRGEITLELDKPLSAATTIVAQHHA